MTAIAVGSSRPTALDRALRIFTEVRSGEGATAVLLTVNIFLILLSYQIMKVWREVWVESATVRAYSAAGQAAVLLLAVPIYGAIAARVPRRRLINVVTAFFVGCIAVFAVLAWLGAPAGVYFFIWVGVFNLMIPAQFWGFANDLYTTDQGKRLFPLVAFGASVGAFIGAWVPGLLIGSHGGAELLVLAALVLILATLITNLADRRAGHAPVELVPAATGEYRLPTGEFREATPEYARASGTFRAVGRAEEQPVRETPRGPALGHAFQLVFRSRYLLLIALLMVFLNWVNTTGEFIVKATVESAAPEAQARFYSGYQSTVNLISMLIQLFLVSRILKYFGVSTALLILPVVAFIGYATLAFYPVLTAIRWAKTAENSLDYSVQNTTRQALFLPTTREEKYAAKQAIDSFFVRFGDLMQAASVYVGVTFLGFATRHFAMLNLALVAIWLVLAVLIGSRYNRLAAATSE
jgi:AAA family ATP:ADP antiporter